MGNAPAGKKSEQNEFMFLLRGHFVCLSSQGLWVGPPASRRLEKDISAASFDNPVI